MSSLPTRETLGHINRSESPGECAEQYVRSLVDRWDDIIDWNRRKVSEQSFFVEALRQVKGRRVLDAATGTGFHSVMFTEAGFDVTSVDGSEEMLSRAIQNGRKRGLELQIVRADWRYLGSKLKQSYDAIVCLGSSFPHLFHEADREKALLEFYSALKPGGMLILDHRNFNAIRASRYKSSGNYYYCGTGVDISVDYVDDRLCRFRYKFDNQTTNYLEVYPILMDEFRDLLFRAGFDSIQTFGDFKDDFDINNTDFLIHIARKP